MEAGETLYSRLAAAQAEMENPAMDRENPRFRNRFASLAAIRNAVVPCLARHGLACVQVVEGGRVVTRVYGPEGDSIDLAGVPVSLAGNPQANGSEMTYAKRYSMSAAFCVVGDEDDDGEAATAGWQGGQAPQGARQAPAPRQQPQRPASGLTEPQRAEGAAMLNDIERARGWGMEQARAALFAAVGNPPREAAAFAAWAPRAHEASARICAEGSPAHVAGQQAAQAAEVTAEPVYD